MRDFVKHKLGDYKSATEVLDGKNVSQSNIPLLSVIIPTLDGYRNGYFPELLGQLREQSFQDFETIVVKGDHRQGRAINKGASIARGTYLMTLDDDTRLGHPDLLKALVNVLDENPEIGMAGVPNLIPQDASWFVKRTMLEIPRRSSNMVDEITTSDMAEHPCLIMRKDVFFEVGGENELIPRGLDPYLRQAFRDAGCKVVVIPDVFIHHLPPDSFSRLIKQFFRNGKAAAYVNKFYPEWVYELTTDHSDLFEKKTSWSNRIIRQLANLSKGFIRFHFFYLFSQITYITGFLWGFMTMKNEQGL